jgi:hypothetical protein
MMEAYNESWLPCQKALYWDKQGDWDRAHRIVQDVHSTDAAWVHAYLHRKEGDTWNAAYWYSRAGKPFYNNSLEEEWKILWKYFTGAGTRQGIDKE